MILPTTVPSLTVYASWNSATDRAQVSHLSIPLCRVQIPSPGSDCWAGLHWGKELAVIWIPRSISGQSLRMVYGLWMLMVWRSTYDFCWFLTQDGQGMTNGRRGRNLENTWTNCWNLRWRDMHNARKVTMCMCVCVCFFSCCDFEWVRALCKA